MATSEQDKLSLSDFKRKSADVIKQIQKSRQPVVLTVNGEAQLVVQDVKSYQQMIEALERAEAVAGIRKGLEALERGETQPIHEAFAELRRKHGLPD